MSASLNLKLAERLTMIGKFALLVADAMAQPGLRRRP